MYRDKLTRCIVLTTSTAETAGKVARNMFERFTDRARRVVVLAQEEARMRNHNYIGTEHILLGLIYEGKGVAAQALESLGITQQAVRQQVDEIIGRGHQAPSGHIPFTPRAKKVLKLSLGEAMQLGHHYIGTEHILLSLIREGEGVAAQVLVGLGADLDRAREQVIELLDGDQGKAEPGGPLTTARTILAGRGKRKVLPQLLDRFQSLESRLSGVEHRVGTGPDVRDLDQEIMQARRDKESAIDMQDFETAAVLRDKERQLLDEKDSRQEEWAAAHLDLPSVSDEVKRLRDLLRRHGIEPHDGAA
jgi:ATP-dependent Clp protease ATP-binding subunit ClpA